MAKGGVRPGSGRKKGSKATHTIQAEQARAHFIKRVTDELDPLIDAQLDLAKGVYVEQVVKTPSGERQVRVYQKEPENKAIDSLVQQTIGKPKESIEHTGEAIHVVLTKPTKRAEG